MKPFIARDDSGRTVLVLAFVTLQRGGRVWTMPVEDIRDAIPNQDWPLGWRFRDEVPA